jgi:hypothetical protein
MILFGNHKTAATEVRADLNIRPEHPVSTKGSPYIEDDFVWKP